MEDFRARAVEILSSIRQHRENSLAVGFLACIILVLAICPTARPIGILRDFNAFYCAGEAVGQNADPYRTEPMGTCERRPKPDEFQAGRENLTLPAPLPPYDFAILEPISRLPYVEAVILWTTILLLSYVAITYMLADMTRIQPGIVAMILGPTVAYGCSVLGEIIPITLAGIVFAAWMHERDKPVLSALGAVVGMTSPHVGLPVIAALGLCVPKTRLPIAIGALGLAATCVALVGYDVTWEYFKEVLPAHAISEISSSSQMSLTALAHAFGARDHVAVSLGTLSYLAMFALAVGAAREFSLRNARDSLVVLAPIAMILLGGVFLHVTQMAAALPCALILYGRTTGWTRRIVACGATLVAVPWVQFEFLGTILALIAGVTVGLTYSTMLVERRSRVIAYTVGLVGFAFVVLLNIGTIISTTPTHPPLPPTNASDLAEVGWRLNMESIKDDGVELHDVARAPSWIGIALITATLAVRARRTRKVS